MHLWFLKTYLTAVVDYVAVFQGSLRKCYCVLSFIMAARRVPRASISVTVKLWQCRYVKFWRLFCCYNLGKVNEINLRKDWKWIRITTASIRVVANLVIRRFVLCCFFTGFHPIRRWLNGFLRGNCSLRTRGCRLRSNSSSRALTCRQRRLLPTYESTPQLWTSLCQA